MKRDPFKDFILDQLGALDKLRCRAMFGAHGLYLDGRFFGIVLKGRLYFKINAAERPEYEKRGMGPFRPSAQQTLKSYYEVPPEVIEDQKLLAAWARRAAKN
jgi:DNA transformation protein